MVCFKRSLYDGTLYTFKTGQKVRKKFLDLLDFLLYSFSHHLPFLKRLTTHSFSVVTFVTDHSYFSGLLLVSCQLYT